MTSCLQLKKSNCKNCYKCIRHCPVKSIRFSEGQAHIVNEECILCGMCFVVCPQNAKQVRNDIDKAKALIASGRPVYVSLAPASLANYKEAGFGGIKAALLQLGFAGVEETAIGATIVKKQYEALVQKREKKVIISSCCHSVNTLIQKHYPDALPYLAKVLSPMQAHCQKLKEEHPDCATVFIGPCISKKDEAEKYPGLVDCVLTFEELSDWLDEEGVALAPAAGEEERGRARLFPTAGGILRTMDLDPDFHYVTIDGVENCMNALEDIANGALTDCFVEMSACVGSCIGGPVMNRTRTNPVSDYIAINREASQTDFAVTMPEEKRLSKVFAFDGVARQMPGSAAIAEILKKMGKDTPEQELNCGSCGYNTCREKAVAVLMGKANLEMCLPYLKEKAESFSDKIIHNTPNGIIVCNDQLEVQQINAAACNILNIRREEDVKGSPMVRILDPSDYVLAMENQENTYEKRKFLAEYQKYVEETIIYDREYHIIMSIMKDVTEEEILRESKEQQSKQAVEITDKVVEKQMRVVQEIASLLGETTAETKIALTKLKETLCDE